MVEENAKDIVKSLANTPEMKVENHHIAVAHRLPAERGIPKIIVKFNDMDKKTEMIKKSKQAKLEIDANPIFVNEHLMPKTIETLKAAKQLRNEGKIKFVWMRK